MLAVKIEISYTDKTPRKAADIVNHVTKNYLEYDKERKTRGNKKIMKFIDERIGALGEELARTEREIQNFKINNNYVDPDNLEADVLEKVKGLEDGHIKLNMEKCA